MTIIEKILLFLVKEYNTQMEVPPTAETIADILRSADQMSSTVLRELAEVELLKEATWDDSDKNNIQYCYYITNKERKLRSEQPAGFTNNEKADVAKFMFSIF